MTGSEIARISGSYSTAFIETSELTEQNISGNYSKFKIRVYGYYGGGTSAGSSYCTVWISGTEYNYGSYRMYPGTYTLFAEKDITVYHNNDGSFPSTTVAFGIDCYHASGETSGTLSAPPIPRAPSYTSKNASNITEHSVRLTATIDTKGLSITGGGWDLSTDGGTTWTYYGGEPTDKTITGLNSGTQYWYRGYVTTDGGNVNSSWSNFTTKDCVINQKINNSWKKCVPYKKVSGTWKKCIPYINVNGTWKEGIN